MPAIRTIVKVSITPYGPRIAYDVTAKGKGIGKGAHTTHMVSMRDSFEVPFDVVDCDGSFVFEEASSTDRVAGLSGVRVTCNSRADSWAFSAGVDVDSCPALVLEHERTTPNPAPDTGDDGGNPGDGAPPADHAGTGASVDGAPPADHAGTPASGTAA
jgi:hypothetical protein